MAIGEQQPETIEEAARAVQAAADRLGVVLSEHATVIARAKAAVAKMGARLAVAQQTGTLVFFNRKYLRRLAARAAGRSLRDLRRGEAALAQRRSLRPSGGRGKSERLGGRGVLIMCS
jgi:hypothetical protein